MEILARNKFKKLLLRFILKGAVAKISGQFQSTAIFQEKETENFSK